MKAQKKTSKKKPLFISIIEYGFLGLIVFFLIIFQSGVLSGERLDLYPAIEQQQPSLYGNAVYFFLGCFMVLIFLKSGYEMTKGEVFFKKSSLKGPLVYVYGFIVLSLIFIISFVLAFHSLR